MCPAAPQIASLRPCREMKVLPKPKEDLVDLMLDLNSRKIREVQEDIALTVSAQEEVDCC